MHFANPIWLLVGGIVSTTLLLLMLRSERLKAKACRVLSGTRAREAALPIPTRVRRWLRTGIAALAIAAGFVALARPQKGMHWETTKRKGIDLMLVVDTSRSMDADDVKPTRLERVKLAVRDLVDKFPGDRVGVIAFAGDAFVQSPMTLDHSAVLDTVSALDTSTIAYGGTDIGHALELARSALASEPAYDKTVLLISDGEDLQGHGLEAAKQAAADHITIDTVGVGSAPGELVPMRDDRGRIVGVMRDEQGRPVRSRLDEAGLRAIASSTGGSYRPLGSDGQGLERLYHDSLAPKAHLDASSRTHRVYSEWFEVPLSIALAGILLDSLLGLSFRKRHPRGGKGVRTVASVTAIVCACFVPGVAHASAWSAQKSYNAGHFDAAATEYATESAKHPKDARLAFNAGDAAYRAGRYDLAEAAFKRALASADARLRPQVLFNQGDSLYRLGANELQHSREQTIEHWKQSIAAFDSTLKLNPKDADARFNRDFVQRKLKELEDQKSQPPQQKPDSKQGSQQQPNSNGHDSKRDHDKKNGQGAKDSKQPKGADAANATNGHSPRTGASKDQPQNVGQQKGASQNTQTAEANDSQSAKGRSDSLSPSEARALLRSLRGDERRAIRHQEGPDAGVSSDDAPGKDW